MLRGQCVNISKCMRLEADADVSSARAAVKTGVLAIHVPKCVRHAEIKVNGVSEAEATKATRVSWTTGWELDRYLTNAIHSTHRLSVSPLTHSAATTAHERDAHPSFNITDNRQAVLGRERDDKARLFGYALERGKVYTPSTDHSFHLLEINVKRGTFKHPNPAGSYATVSASLAVAPVEVGDRYIVAPEAIKAKDRQLFTAVISTINNRKRDDYDTASLGSGINLIEILLSQESRSASAELGTWAARQLADLIAAGMEAPTTVAFDTFRETYENFNFQLPNARCNPPSVVAEAYAAATTMRKKCASPLCSRKTHWEERWRWKPPQPKWLAVGSPTLTTPIPLLLMPTLTQTALAPPPRPGRTWRYVGESPPSLTPTSPCSDFRALSESALGLGVSLRIRGSDSRSRSDILADIRAVVGLGPFETRVPFGIAVDPAAPFPDLAVNTEACLSTNASANEPEHSHTPLTPLPGVTPTAAKCESGTTASGNQSPEESPARPALSSSSARRRPDRRSANLCFGGSGAHTPLGHYDVLDTRSQPVWWPIASVQRHDVSEHARSNARQEVTGSASSLTSQANTGKQSSREGNLSPDLSPNQDSDTASWATPPLCVDFRTQWKTPAEKECFAHTLEISRSLPAARQGKKYNFFFAE
ncbi:MAG: hypothetical protein SGPRY_009997 [Prymnesium sp.]